MKVDQKQGNNNNIINRLQIAVVCIFIIGLSLFFFYDSSDELTKQTIRTAWEKIEKFLPFPKAINSSEFFDVLDQKITITNDSIVNSVNSEREKYYLTDLSPNEKLSQAAQTKAADMCEKQYWAHVAPDGNTPWIFIKNAGYSYSVAGENLARDFYDSQTMVTAWMGSPEHKANIINKEYKETGVAVKECKLQGIQTVVVVQLFGNPSSGRVGYDQISGTSGGGSYTNPNTPVHCPINKMCGGGTIPLTFAECQNSTCCKLNDGWKFYKDKSECASEQKKQNIINDDKNVVGLDGYTDPNQAIHCKISQDCGGGTIPLTNAECSKTVCCHIGDKYIFMRDINDCTNYYVK